jgi:hypothetical protein
MGFYSGIHNQLLRIAALVRVPNAGAHSQCYVSCALRKIQNSDTFHTVLCKTCDLISEAGTITLSLH